MQLLLDQGLPRTAAKLLREAGIDTVHVGEINMSTAKDAEILERGHKEQRVIITLDSDFHRLLALSSAHKPSVVRVRIEGLKAKAYVPLITTILTQCAQDLKQGCVVTVQNQKIRIRHLPIGGD